jgi:hypothetical protein
MLELKYERQERSSDRSLDHDTFRCTANQHTQDGPIDITSDLAGIGMNTVPIRGCADEPVTVPPIEHVITGTPEDFQRRGKVERPQQFQLKFELFHRPIFYAHLADSFARFGRSGLR